MEYFPTIGLEIHAELKTKTKMFCSSRNDPDEERVNTNICPVCMGHPGSLPVVNQEAVRHVLRVGAAVGGTLADFTEFDRKSYFYPDIPKGYQISQYEHPLVAGGSLAGVAITRVHLEEDTARSVHLAGASLVDFNRAGVPLMELVTEPVIHDAVTAGTFARELQLLLRTLGAGDANLEKGEMRVEANISVSNVEGVYGTKVEVKNLNSFRSVERAISYEIARQSELLTQGGTVVQETRGWDEGKQSTFHQRFKEGSADYRYFPDPDLPKLSLREIPECTPEAIRATLPELPWDRRARYMNQLGVRASDAAFLSETLERATFFDRVVEALHSERERVLLATNYMVSDLAGLFARSGGDRYDTVHPGMFAKLISLTHAGTLSSRSAKDVLGQLVLKGGDPEEVARSRGLIQSNDPMALEAVVEEVLSKEGVAVDEYRSGKMGVLQYLIGKCMQAAGGTGNPGAFSELLTRKLQ